MNEPPKPSPILSGAYWLARETGLFRIGWFRRTYARAYFAYKGHLEDPFEGLVRRRPDLFKGGHILDVGANIGYNSALFLRALSPGFRIYAFEPDASNLTILQETILDYRAEGTIIPVPSAVGDFDGEAELWRNPSHPGDHRLATPAFRMRIGARPETSRVRIQTIDGFLESQGQGSSPIAFVKIDVQGAEPAVFRGMERSLARCPAAVVAFEYGPSEIRSLGFDPAPTLEFFTGRGYFLYLVQKDGDLRRFETTALEKAVDARGYVDLLGTSTEIEDRPREAS
jgi:FkbM family methyltransferase